MGIKKLPKIHPMFAKPMFAGTCAGIDLVRRGEGDDHIKVVLCVEDEGLWHRATSMSSHWLDELIEQLERARSFVKTQEPDMFEGRQYGYRFGSKGRKDRSYKAGDPVDFVRSAHGQLWLPGTYVANAKDWGREFHHVVNEDGGNHYVPAKQLRRAKEKKK